MIHPERTSTVDDVTEAACAIHEAIEIKCFYEGNSTLLVGSKTIYAKAGDVVVINPYEFHATVDPGADENKGKYHLIMVPLDYFGDSTDLDLRNLILVKNKANVSHKGDLNYDK